MQKKKLFASFFIQTLKKKQCVSLIKKIIYNFMFFLTVETFVISANQIEE
jgi:hypothetical protein